jgi:hypothetical protein
VNKTTLYLPDGLRLSLKELARREARAQSDIIREALDEYLARKARPQLRSLGLGSDPDLNARDSEAWLEDNWPRG